MTEKELQAAVVELAGYLKWRCYHTYDSRRSNAGFPDLTLVRGETLIFAELKSEKGKLRPEQVEWLDDLACVAQVYVWRPAAWTEGRIEKVLRYGA